MGFYKFIVYKAKNKLTDEKEVKAFSETDLYVFIQCYC